MRFTINNHWLTTARTVYSPNHNHRSDEHDISLLVIHCISLPPAEFGTAYIDQLFSNTLNADEHPYFAKIHQLKVSAHVLIDRTGEITQYVAFNQRAWHAGSSSYSGRADCNDFSIGIELEGTEQAPFSAQQYQQLAKLSVSLVDHYPNLSRQRICAHSDIAPGRKTDPGRYFDWLYFNRLMVNCAKTDNVDKTLPLK
jgi:AmpD protein